MRKSLKNFAVLALGALSACGFAVAGVVGAAETETTYHKYDVFACDANVSETTDGFAFATNPQYHTNTVTGKSESGVAIYTQSGSAGFSYKNPIKMTDKTSSDSLVELYALYDWENKSYASMTSLTITLTDANDPYNEFSVYFYQHTNGAIYARVNYNGKSLGVQHESSGEFKRLWDNKFGECCYTTTFTGLNYDAGTDTYTPYGADTKYPFSIAMDYQEREIYLVNAVNVKNSFVLLDLDDYTMVGTGSEWDGFSSDMAYLSVAMQFNSSQKGGVVVKSIDGTNLDGAFASDEDFPAPTIDFLCEQDYLTEMPIGTVGVEYPLPAVYARDWYFGECTSENVSVQINQYNTNTGEYDLPVVTKRPTENFVTDVIGKYELVYTATNGKRSTSERLYVNIAENAVPIIIRQESDYETPMLLEKLFIPKVLASGGSGKLIVTETLYYNGEEIALPVNRMITLDKAGILSLRVQCKGYTGETIERWFPIEIPEATVLSVGGMPMLLRTGTEIVFPMAKAYNSADMSNATVQITVDDVVLGADRKYTPTKTEGTCTVVYTATSSMGLATKTFVIPVKDTSSGAIIPMNFLLTESGAVDLTNDNSGISITTAENSSIYWGYPIVTGNAGERMKIQFSVLNGKTAFRYVDVVFTDYYDNSNVSFIRVYRDYTSIDENCYIQINGEGTVYNAGGSLENVDKQFYIFLNTATGNIYNPLTFQIICTIDGYNANVSRVGLRFGDVSGETGIRLSILGNQELKYRAGRGDSQEPQIAFDKEMSPLTFVNVGTKVVLPSVTAYDMLSDGATVNVKVQTPDGATVSLSTAKDGSQYFIVEQAVRYTIVCVPKDIYGNSYNFQYSYQGVDVTAPVLTVSKTLKSELDAGITVTIPTATAVDNVNGNCDVYVYMRYVADNSMEELTMGQKYAFAKTGIYELVYFTRDDDFNYTEYVQRITIVESNETVTE